MARIDTATLRATADLAQLDLSESDLSRLLTRLDGVLTHFAALDRVDTDGVDTDGVDTDGVEPAPYHLSTPSRPETGPPGTPLSQAEVLANAPASRDGAFVVPRMVDR